MWEILIHQPIFLYPLLSFPSFLYKCTPASLPRPRVTVSCKTVVLSFAFLAEERGNGRDEEEGRETERDRERGREEELFCSLRASSLSCVPVCSSRVHARSRRLPSICPHLSLSLYLLVSPSFPPLNLSYSLSFSFHFFFPPAPSHQLLTA